MGRIVIACYKPKPGKQQELEALMETHLPILKGEDLVTDRASIIMRSEDGTVIEVFEWRSKEAIASAHTNPAVLEMWQRFGEVCDYVPITGVGEASALFSDYTPMN